MIPSWSKHLMVRLFLSHDFGLKALVIFVLNYVLQPTAFIFMLLLVVGQYVNVVVPKGKYAGTYMTTQYVLFFPFAPIASILTVTISFPLRNLHLRNESTLRFIVSHFPISNHRIHTQNKRYVEEVESQAKNSKGPMDILKEYQIVFVLLGAVIVCGAIVGILNATGKEGPNHL